MEPSPVGKPLDDSERAELLWLRSQVADTSPGQSGGTTARGEHRVLRWTAVTVLLVIVAILAYSAVLSRYARAEVLDTDHYVETVTPLAESKVLHDELAAQITDEIMKQADIEKVTGDALTALTENAPNVPKAVTGLAPVLAGQARSFIEATVQRLLASDQFQTLWVEANRRAHESLVAVLTGDRAKALQIGDDGTVSIELKPIIDNVRGALTDRGFSFASNIPEINKSFVIFRSPDLVKAQRAVNALDKAATVLPFLVFLVGVAAIWAAPRGARRRAFSLFGVTIAIAMALLAISISIGRSIYLDAVPADVMSNEAAAVLIDTLIVPLRTALRAVAVLGIVIALVGYLTGSSASAAAIRRGFSKGMNSARGNASGRVPHPAEIFAARFRLPLRVGIIAIAIIVLVFWDYPSGLVVMMTALIAVLALLAVELLARPAIGYTPAEPDPDTSGQVVATSPAGADEQDR
jgi:hypothetical protein